MKFGVDIVALKVQQGHAPQLPVRGNTSVRDAEI
jgi:hypothetical protein